jgi:uncharacterized protein YktA (UPF0223 family)
MEEQKVKINVEPANTELIDLINKVKQLEIDKDMLLQVADKKQLGLYYQRNKGKIPSRVMLRTMITKLDPKDLTSDLVEKVIVGWRTTQDEVFVDPLTMRWQERQKVELLYDDGTSEEFQLMDYTRKYKQVEAEVKSKITDEETGNLAFKVMRLDTGKEYTIGATFIN